MHLLFAIFSFLVLNEVISLPRKCVKEGFPCQTNCCDHLTCIVSGDDKTSRCFPVDDVSGVDFVEEAVSISR